MRQLHGVVWALIAVCFLALVGCAHTADRTPTSADDLKSGTTQSDESGNGVNPWRSDIMERNHGGGRQIQYNAPTNLPQLQMPALRSAASAPQLAGFAPTVLNSSTASNVQPSYGWFVFAVAFLFALIYAVRRSNALPADEEARLKS